MRLDYHMHTPLCKHAVGEPREYVERALAVGLPEIGFTDHCPMPAGFDDSWRMTEAEFPRYLDMIRDVQGAYRGRLTIRLGMEADYVPGTEDWMRGLIARAPFDFVIGSVHYLDGWNFDHDKFVAEFGKRDIDRTYVEYFDVVERMARSRLFHVVGHMDLMKKFGHRPSAFPREAVERALIAVRDAGMAVELNTSGLRRPCKEIYPERRIVEMAREMGIGFTTSSDSHRPQEVGTDLDVAERLLRDLGVRTLASFNRGRPAPVPI